MESPDLFDGPADVQRFIAWYEDARRGAVTAWDTERYNAAKALTIVPTIPVGDIASNHLPENDGVLLGHLAYARSPGWATVASFDTGWFVRVGVPADADDRDETNQAIRHDYQAAGLSDTFLRLLDQFQRQGLAHVRFHADGPELPGWERFDW